MKKMKMKKMKMKMKMKIFNKKMKMKLLLMNILINKYYHKMMIYNQHKNFLIFVVKYFVVKFLKY